MATKTDIWRTIELGGMSQLLDEYGVGLSQDKLRELMGKLRGELGETITTAFETKPKTRYLTSADIQSVFPDIQPPSDWQLKVASSPENWDEYISTWLSPWGTEYPSTEQMVILPSGEWLPGSELAKYLKELEGPQEGMVWPEEGGRVPISYYPVEGGYEVGPALPGTQPGGIVYGLGERAVPITYEPLPEGGWKVLPLEKVAVDLQQALVSVFPDITKDDTETLLAYMQESPDQFQADMKAIGYTPDTEALLQELFPGITETQMKDYLGITVIEKEGFWKDAWDALYLGLYQAKASLGAGIEALLVAFGGTSDVPTQKEVFPIPTDEQWANLVALNQGKPLPYPQEAKITLPPDLLKYPSYSGKIPEGQEEKSIAIAKETLTYRNQQLAKQNEALTQNYEARQSALQVFLQKNPDLMPKPEYTESIADHPELLKDPGYYAYVILSNAPMIATALAISVGTTLVTRNPFAGAVAGAAALTPSQIGQVYDDLIKNGAPPTRAADLATISGTAIGAVEIIPEMIVLRYVAPTFMKLFGRNLSSEMAERMVTRLSAKGILKAAGQIELAETAEEVLQQAMQNATVKTINENRSLLEGLLDTAIQTAIAVFPMAIFGGGAEYLNMKAGLSPAIQNQIDTEAQKLKDAGLSPDHAEAAAFAKVLETDPSILEGITTLTKEQMAEVAKMYPLKPPITEADWVRLSMADRVELVKSLGMEGKVASKEWAMLTGVEKRNLTTELLEVSKAPVTEGVTEPPYRIYDRKRPGEPIESNERYGAELLLPSGKYRRIGLFASREEALKAIQKAEPAIPKAEAEIAGLKEYLASDPARKLINLMRKVGWYKGEVKTLTLEQYRDLTGKTEILPNILTADKKHVRWEYALDDVATEMGYESGEALKMAVEKAGEVKARIRELESQIARSLEPTVSADEIPLHSDTLTATSLTNSQIDTTLKLFKQAILAPTAAEQRAATIELRKHVLAQRASNAQSRVKELIAEGRKPSDAIAQANTEFLSGKLPEVTTDYFSDLTAEMTHVLQAKVYNYWINKDYFELTSTMTALTNALRGESIPRKIGTGTKYFPNGGSAWDRLVRVFGDQPEILDALDKGKSLPAIIEGIIIEEGRGPVTLDKKFVDYLKGLATLTDEDRAILEKPISELNEKEVRVIAEQEYFRRKRELDNLLAGGTISDTEYRIDLSRAKDKVYPYKPVTPFEAPIEDAWKQVPLITLKEKQTITRTLKGLGMIPIDIGNLIRANKASFDFSFWRQVKTLVPGNPAQFYRANIEAFKALFSQRSAEASWEWIKSRPSYPYYAKMVQRTGQDFLRMLVAPKGTAQWQAAEEFGYLTGERAIPRFTAKLPWIKWSGRSFVTGTNTMTILTYDKCLEATLRRAEMIARGQIKLKTGEAFDIQQDMDDYGKAIAWMTQRASLGKAKVLAPEASAIFFAARSKLGRFLTPKLLIDANPRVRAFAWKNLTLFVGVTASFVMLGKWLDLWDVEDDPRNAEFMSIRIGNLRIDPWAGNRQFIVLYARLLSGTGISSVTGQEYEVNPIGALTTFFRTSLAPLSSILLDFWTGKDFLGEKVDVTNKKQWLDRIIPFAIQDVLDAFQEGWQSAAIAVLPAIVGEGVQTYTGDWRENWAKMGLPKYLENTAYGINEPVYDIADFWADTASQFKGVDPETLTERKGFPPYTKSIAETQQIIEQLNILPNKRLTSLNADPEKGATFADYFRMWQERLKITDEEKLKAFDADERTKNAYLGNMTQRQYTLLVEYHSLPPIEQAQFLADNPELWVNPREEWLRSHPAENALLAVWGKADIFSLEALGKIDGLAKELDIPDNAMVVRELDEITKLKLKNKEYLDLLEVYSGLDNTTKDAEGLTARDRAINDLKADNLDAVDDMRRIDAINVGTKDNPIPQDIVEGWVERGRVIDQFGAGSTEAKLWLLDNPKVHKWALDNAMLTDDLSDENITVLRLKSQYADLFDLYDAYGDRASPEYITDDKKRQIARDKLLADNPQFADDRRRIEAYSMKFPDDQIESYVEYNKLPDKGYWKDRYLLEHPDFYQAMVDLTGKVPFDKGYKVPDVRYDQIYEKYKDLFEKYDNVTGTTSERAAARDQILKSNPDFAKARYERDAYYKFIPNDQVSSYVGYYLTLDMPTELRNIVNNKWYEDDWYLIDHKGFYDTMVSLKLWQPRDFTKVPTRHVFALYERYQLTPKGQPRMDLRKQYPELDDWLILIGEVSVPAKEQGATVFPSIPDEEDEGIPSKEGIDTLVKKYGFTRDEATLALSYKNYVGMIYGQEPLATEEDIINLIDRMTKEFTPTEILAELEDARAFMRTGGVSDEETQALLDKAKEYNLLDELGIKVDADIKSLRASERQRLYSAVEEKTAEIRREAKLKEADILKREASSGWIDKYAVPTEEAKDWVNYPLTIELINSPFVGAYYAPGPAEGQKAWAIMYVPKEGGGYEIKLRGHVALDIDQVKPETLAHELAHANYFENLPTGLQNIYPYAHYLAQIISPEYREKLQHGRQVEVKPGKLVDRAILPVEGYAVAYAKYALKPEKMPWYLEPFYGNLMYEVPEDARGSLAWLTYWVRYELEKTFGFLKK